MSTLLKDIYFQKQFVIKLANKIIKMHVPFNISNFYKSTITQNWNEKPLKVKMHTISMALYENLPSCYDDAITILMKIESEFHGFNHLVFSDFVERYGIDHYDESMKAIEKFTRSSSEFAIRPFITRYQKNGSNASLVKKF